MAKGFLYLDCFSGISGDMFVGALLDVGLNFHELKEGLLQLKLNGFEVRTTRVKRGGIMARAFLVEVDKSARINRTWVDIRSILEQSHLTDEVKKQAIALFSTLAQVEAEIHGVEPEKVHFHEVGGVDSIVDIVAAVLGIHLLGIQQIKASPLPHNRGWVETEHGLMPLPAPATASLMKNIPIVPSNAACEQVTPTGALLVSQLANDFGNIPSMVIEKVGYGAGTKDYPNAPNYLRVYLGTCDENIYSDRVILFTANIDNQNPEFYSYLMDRLQEEGALDIALSPLQMKKNRPGTQLQVIAWPHQRFKIQNTILKETNTLGLRVQEVERTCIKREKKILNTPWGKVTVKIHFPPDSSPRFMPEYEDCARIAREQKHPINEVYTTISRLAEKDSDI